MQPKEYMFSNGTLLQAWPNNNFKWSPRTPRKKLNIQRPGFYPSERMSLEVEKDASDCSVVQSSSSDNDSECEDSFDTPEEELLYAARHGIETKLLRLLINSEEAVEGNKININCKGNQKFNRGWTPLHLAAYFGQDASVRLLLEFGASVNILNALGESPLHLAAYTNREEVVGLLLKYGADTSLINSKRQKACNVTENQHILDMLQAADQSEHLRLEVEFLAAASNGDTEKISYMLEATRGLSVNAVDSFGNSALHLSTMQSHGAVAAFLMQHGIDASLRNSAGQTAVDLAQTQKLKQLLGVQPIKDLHLVPQRFEGYLLKKSRFTGLKYMWVVLDRGVLSYFRNRGDASTGSKRKGMRYLDEAQVIDDFLKNAKKGQVRGVVEPKRAQLPNTKEFPTQIQIAFSDGSKHTLHIQPPSEVKENSVNGNRVLLQKWLNALEEHISYNSYYIHKGQASSDRDEDEELQSLGTMRDSLQTAQAHRVCLEKQVVTLRGTVAKISQEQLSNASQNTVITVGDLRTIESQAIDIMTASQEMCNTLTHCLALIAQQEELREHQLQEERERCRLLQDSLHALATEHHELERTLSRRPSFVSMDDEFFDCDDDEVCGSATVEAFSDALSRDLVMDDGNNHKKGSTYGRNTLPVPMFSRSDFSFWSILKQCIGKELSKITMPVVFNEPLSFIQRLSEYMAYAPLLEKAIDSADPIERMTNVAAFAVSAVSSNLGRIGKPFNPLLGETYELDRPELGFRYVGEQVSHHPPVTAFHADGKSYSFFGSIQPKLKFWGKTVEINPKGVITLQLHKYNETYTWSNVNCCIHNIIVGTLWVEHYGTMEISCNSNSLKAVLHFKQAGWFAKDLHRIEGFIYNGKQKEMAIYGSWVQGLYACRADSYEKQIADPDFKSAQAVREKEEGKNCLTHYNYNLRGQKTIWQVDPKPSYCQDYYQFSLFSMSLNELVPGMSKSLPPTDSRFRPDIRHMEEGNIDSSATEKNRVEEKQRERRKDRKKKNQEWRATWFKIQPHPVTGKDEWTFNQKYWERNWKVCPDIF